MIQVHLMPSAGCLGTYLWHGVRQYTPRTLSTITRLFGAETRRQVFFLGGSECNRVHRRFITYPWLRNGPDPRQLQPASYEQQLRAAIAKDDDAPARGDACIHGLVLQSKLGEDVFAS